mgnify:CR=1 FL=1
MARGRGGGRPSKYKTHVQPYLEQIKEWKKNGATDEQVCEQLGVSVSSFCEYKLKYSELTEVLKNSREAFVAELRGELARLAFKHTLETVKVYSKTDESGQSVTYKEKTSKEVDGDIAAIHLLLKNLDKENWADNPQGLKIKQQELELKKALAEAQNFDISFDEKGDKK